MSTEVATRPEFAIVEASQAQAFAESIAELSPGDLRIPRVKVPGSGGTIWEIPSDDPSKSAHTEKLTGVVVDQYRTDVLYLDEYSGDNSPPDALWISKDFVHATDDAIAAGVIQGAGIDEQPLNEFGSGEGGNGKAISNRWRIFLLGAGELLPIQIDIPTMSRKHWIDFYTQRIASRGLTLTQVVVSLGLRKATNKGGIDYAEVIPAVEFQLSDEQAAHFAAQAQSLKAITRRTFAEDTPASVQDVAVEGDEEV